MHITLTRIKRKYEARNPKFETNPKYKCSNVQNMEPKLFEITMFVDSVLVICILKIENLFAAYALRTVRISIFGFRIYFLPEKTRISELRYYA